MKVYLDNAATTPLAKEVFEEIAPYFTSHLEILQARILLDVKQKMGLK